MRGHLGVVLEIPKPSAVDRVGILTEMLDAAPHEVRLEWARSLNGKEQYRLFDLAKEGPALASADLHRGEGEVVIHYGRNGLAMFNLFQKRCVHLQGQNAGYNHNGFPSAIRGIAGAIIGPGHYVFYDSPDVPGEVWIDYRRIPTVQHPDFPALITNEGGLRQLVYGNMVDVMRRVSKHIFIGDSFKNLPREDKPPLLTRLASRFGATAPFILCQDPS
jgi:hypothetical protein